MKSIGIYFRSQKSNLDFCYAYFVVEGDTRARTSGLLCPKSSQWKARAHVAGLDEPRKALVYFNMLKWHDGQA